VVTPHHFFDVTGVGYDDNGGVNFDGALKLNGQAMDWHQDKSMEWLVNIAGQTTDAQLHFENNRWELTGEPTDGALTTLYRKMTGHDPEVAEIDSLPFDSAFRFSARLADLDGQRLLMVKGSPATVLRLTNQAHNPEYWEHAMSDLTSDGLRVVALAYQVVDDSVDTIDAKSISGLELAGMVGIIDPPREEAATAIAELRKAGVEVKMITGDHPDTAMAIANKLHLAPNFKAISGPE
ncbi:HAD family hydrolase, partial [Enterococcus faecium]